MTWADEGPQAADQGGEALMRALAMALPGVQERDHFGVPSWRVGGKIFAQLTARPGRAILKAPKPRQELLFEVRPHAFSPNVWGRLVWCNVELDQVDASELAELLRDAWGEVAPKSLKGRSSERVASGS